MVRHNTANTENQISVVLYWIKIVRSIFLCNIEIQFVSLASKEANSFLLLLLF